MNQRPLNDQEIKWQAELRELIANYRVKLANANNSTTNIFKGGYYNLLQKLSLELQAMKEDFSTRIIGIVLKMNFYKI